MARINPSPIIVDPTDVRMVSWPRSGDSKCVRRVSPSTKTKAAAKRRRSA